MSSSKSYSTLSLSQVNQGDFRVTNEMDRDAIYTEDRKKDLIPNLVSTSTVQQDVSVLQLLCYVGKRFESYPFSIRLLSTGIGTSRGRATKQNPDKYFQKYLFV
jgi:hypothetical protein